jgi:hypothetical protein
MHTHAVHIRSFAPRALVRHAWIPLCVVLVAIAASAVSGHSLVRGAHAGTVLIEGDVASSAVTLDTTACTASAGTIGDVFLGTDAWRTAQDATGQVCSLTFSAPGNPAGADLIVIDDPADSGVASPALRCTVGACTGHSIADYSSTSEPAANTSAFGTQLINVGGAAAAVWSIAPSVHEVRDTTDVPCHTSNQSDGTCSFTWGVTGAASETPGSYVAHVQSLVVAR